MIKDPERRDASTTTTPEERPAMIRLRIGKFCGRGSVPGGYSETSRCCAAIRSFEPRVLARIVDVEPAADDRDRPARSLERRLVRGGVDAASEPGHDRDPRERELPRQAPRDVAPVARGLARPDDGHGGKAQPLHPPEGEEEKRRIRDLQEKPRIRVVERRHDGDAAALDLGGPVQRLAILRRPQDGTRPVRGAQKWDRSTSLEDRSASRLPRERRTGQRRCGVSSRPRAHERATCRPSDGALIESNRTSVDAWT